MLAEKELRRHKEQLTCALCLGHLTHAGALSNTAGADTASRTMQLLGALHAKAPGPMHGQLPMGIIPDVAAVQGVMPYPGEPVAGHKPPVSEHS